VWPTKDDISLICEWRVSEWRHDVNVHCTYYSFRVKSELHTRCRYCMYIMIYTLWSLTQFHHYWRDCFACIKIGILTVEIRVWIYELYRYRYAFPSFMISVLYLYIIYEINENEKKNCVTVIKFHGNVNFRIFFAVLIFYSYFCDMVEKFLAIVGDNLIEDCEYGLSKVSQGIIRCCIPLLWPI